MNLVFRDRANHIKTLIKQLLIACIKTFDDVTAACLLLSLCGIIDESVKNTMDRIHKTKPDLVFSSDGNDEIVMQKRKASR